MYKILLVMPVETRYFRSDQHTINGLSAYALLNTQGTTFTQVSRYKTSPFGLISMLGVRVWRRLDDGSEVEITDGSPAAVVSVDPGYQGYVSKTWDCPETTLNSTDAIVVRVYQRFYGEESWQLLATFITERLNAQSLNAATWTVQYWVYATYTGNRTIIYFGFGDSAHNSYIDNFSWTVAVTYNLTINVDKTTGYIDETFVFYGTLTQNGTPISGATVTLYKNNVSTGLTDVTDESGNYSIPWTADEVGSHNFFTEATW